MSGIRVFVVDDVAIIRRIVVQILEEEPDITVVGTAGNGDEALQRLPRLDVDLILLDVEMPGINGLELLKALRAGGNTIPVLLFSSLTERGAMVTIEGLLLGANDYVTKPSGMGSAGAARDYVRQQLLPRIRSLVAKAGSPGTPVRRVVPASGKGTVDAVVIGVSTGGPLALNAMIPALPADLPIPLLITQHMPAFFTQALVRRLSSVSSLRVLECTRELAVTPGTVIVAAGGCHMVVERQGDDIVARPDHGEPVNFCRPSADVLFQSAAAVYGGRLLGLVMTGMGEDGLAGCRTLREAGAQIIVQDRASSVVWGMPGAVYQAGLANDVLPLSELAAAITAQARVGRNWFHGKGH